MTLFATLAPNAANRPLALAAHAAVAGAAVLSQHLALVPGVTAGPPSWPERSARRPYELIGGLAIIPVRGVLVQRAGLDTDDGITGYDGIRLRFLAALQDDAAAGIVLDVDSPGGEVSGVADLAETIFRARGVKPIWAILNEKGFSAAYFIASAADRVTVPRTGGTGSIGVIAIHMEESRKNAREGIRVNLLTHGARKGDGNPWQRLPSAARRRFQADIDQLGDMFVRTVARNRGLAPRTVSAMEAGCYLGADGVSAGLADQVAAPDRAFSLLRRRIFRKAPATR